MEFSVDPAAAAVTMKPFFMKGVEIKE